MQEKSEVKVAGAIAIAIVLVSFISMFTFALTQTKIACVGDSITENYGYPNRLQDLLGYRYKVENFGYSGSMVIQSSWKLYINSTDFFQATNFLPNIVVIMLGTNDAGDDIYSSISRFKSDYINLISSFQQLSSKPKIFLVLPPPLFNNNLELNGTTLTQNVIPAIKQIASEQNIPLIDVYKNLEGHPEYFVDGVHPTTAGAKIITDTIYQAIINSK
jgi:lysophospholipase L1-like esterase